MDDFIALDVGSMPPLESARMAKRKNAKKFKYSEWTSDAPDNSFPNVFSFNLIYIWLDSNRVLFFECFVSEQRNVESICDWEKKDTSRQSHQQFRDFSIGVVLAEFARPLHQRFLRAGQMPGHVSKHGRSQATPELTALVLQSKTTGHDENPQRFIVGNESTEKSFPRMIFWWKIWKLNTTYTDWLSLLHS